MKYSFYAALVSLSLISCGNNDSIIEDPRPIDKTVYQFEFKNYNVTGTVLYKGSQGSQSHPDESYLSNYWSLYKEPVWKKIHLDLKNNSINLVSGTSADLTYSIKIVNDSVLINTNDNKPNYLGNFSKNTSTFTLKRTFRYMKRASRSASDGLVIAQNTFFGTTRYENMFGNIFTNPSQMTKSEDVVLWSNIDYDYKAF